MRSYKTAFNPMRRQLPTFGSGLSGLGKPMSFYRVELPYQSDAERYYRALADLPWAVWLDSGGMARHDILTAAPHHTLVLDEDAACGDPFGLLRGELGERVMPVANIPFAGGALGYWSYDLARRMMALPNIAQDEEQLPDMAVGIYDWALVLDHQQRSASLVSHRRFAETARLLPDILSRLHNPKPQTKTDFRVSGKVRSNFTRESYANAYSAVHDYLQAGDCYQINLAQQFSARAEGDAFEAYLRLRSLSPAPYAAFLNLPQTRILCSSPERFISVRDGKVETRPIKGTRARSSDAQEDRQLADDLRNDPKDRAENLMIVDLLRSDLGKSCEPGSVHVPELFQVSYSNVHHLVSTVKVNWRRTHALDVPRGCFPGGSSSARPVARDADHRQLERTGGIYCGATGYAGFDGNMDSNIAIRTLVYSGNEVRCWAEEYRCRFRREGRVSETLDKASAMLELLRHYGVNMITGRGASDRGYAHHGWLEAGTVFICRLPRPSVNFWPLRD